MEPRSDEAPPDKKAEGRLCPPPVLPSSVASDLSPLQKELLTYRRSKEQQRELNQLLTDGALKAYSESMEERRDRGPANPAPELPATMNSEQKERMTNYLFMRSRALSRPVAPMQQQWLTSILTLVPQPLKEGRELLVEQLLEEIRRDFEKSVKSYMVRRVLIKPNVKGLEDEEDEPLPSLPLGLDFSSPWQGSFIWAKKRILSTLCILHPTVRTLLDLGYGAFSVFLLVDFLSFRLKGPIGCESLKNDVSVSCSKAEKTILNTWYQGVVSVFTQQAALSGVKLNRLDSFYSCVDTLMSNQLKELLIRNVEAFVKLFDPEDRSCLPLFKMELILGEKHMEFYPSFQQLEEAVLFVVNHIGQTLQNVQTVRSWLAEGTATLGSELPTHVIAWATSTLKKAIRGNLEGPKGCLENYVERYGWLVDGAAHARVQRFEAEQHSFDEYTAFIDEFFNLKKEIMNLPEMVHFPMICLNCEDLKQGLVSNAKALAEMLMDRIVANYREENVKEFGAIEARVLKVPESTEEMLETVAYVKEVKAKGIRDLLLRVKGCFRQMEYFLDVYLFSPEDITLNSTVLLWPKKINCIFDKHDDLMEEFRHKGEQELTQKSEKLTVELEKLTQTVAELEEYSELGCMQQYVADLRALQKLIQEADEAVAFIHKEETLLKWKLTDFPLLDNLKTEIEPYQKLFHLILKWQQTEKRWMDGAFLELNGEIMEAELDEFTQEMYKMSELFQQKQKKIQQELKKSSRRTVGEKQEAGIKPNPTLTMCSSVLEQMKDFKEYIPTVKVLCNPGIRTHHWQQMSNIVGYDLTPDTGTTLRKVLKQNLAPYLEEFEAQEFSLERAVNAMMETWESVSFRTTLYRETGVHVLSAEDEIQAVLEDQIAKTQTVRGSPFIKPFDKETE